MIQRVVGLQAAKITKKAMISKGITVELCIFLWIIILTYSLRKHKQSDPKNFWEIF